MRDARADIRLGAFEEVLRVEGRYVNDHCLYRHEGRWHFYGIVGPLGRGCYDAGSEVSFAHATSRDLRVWKVAEDVLVVDRTGPDGAHVFAPHVIGRDNRFYMFYTGVDEHRRQRLCVATSEDLYAWRRSEANPVIVPSLSWAKWPGHEGEPANAIGNCRDPHVMWLPEGRYAAYWVAEMSRRYGDDMSCVAASVSDDLEHWEEVGPIFAKRCWSKPPTRSVESPCVVIRDDGYWLFFKHGWATHYVHGDGPFDFRDCQSTPLGYAHAAEVFAWHDRWYITHCSGDPDDPEYRSSNRTRGLFLGELDWPAGKAPRLKG